MSFEPALRTFTAGLLPGRRNESRLNSTDDWSSDMTKPNSSLMQGGLF